MTDSKLWTRSPHAAASTFHAKPRGPMAFVFFVLIPVLVVTALLMSVLWTDQPESEQRVAAIITGAVLVFLILVLITTSRLTLDVYVQGVVVRWRFLFKKAIPYTELADVKASTYRFSRFGGYGCRIGCGREVAWSLPGVMPTVELTSPSGSVFVVTVPEAEAAVQAINNAREGAA